MSEIFIASKSQKMRSLYAMADKAALTGLHILIRGEAGSGKNVLARYIHSLSGRSGKFCRFNPISFTGEEDFEKKVAERFMEARDGTLLIDDVSYCSLKLQDCIMKIWRDQDEAFGRSGYLNVRLIGATTRNLHDLSSQRRFRRSLADRFVLPILIPPLRERKDDIPALMDIFLKAYGGVKAPKLTKESADILHAYSWPGNVRELENVAKQTLFNAAGTGEITPSFLPAKIRRKNASAAKDTVADELYRLAAGLIESGAHSQEVSPYDEYLKIIETPLIKAALDSASGNKSMAAKLLKINRNTVSKKIKEYDIE